MVSGMTPKEYKERREQLMAMVHGPQEVQKLDAEWQHQLASKSKAEADALRVMLMTGMEPAEPVGAVDEAAYQPNLNGDVFVGSAAKQFASKFKMADISSRDPKVVDGIAGSFSEAKMIEEVVKKKLDRDQKAIEKMLIESQLKYANEVMKAHQVGAVSNKTALAAMGIQPDPAPQSASSWEALMTKYDVKIVRWGGAWKYQLMLDNIVVTSENGYANEPSAREAARIRCLALEGTVVQPNVPQLQQIMSAPSKKRNTTVMPTNRVRKPVGRHGRQVLYDK